MTLPEGKIKDCIDGQLRNDTLKELNQSGKYEFNDYNDIPDSDGNLEEIDRPTRSCCQRTSTILCKR